jgi:amidophosphoribosyltransferase
MCGIIGIVSKEEAASKITLGLYDLQHRGEQAAGIAVYDGEINFYKGEGLVTDVFREEEIIKNLKGKFGIGHVLYSTIGGEGESIQPKVIQPIIGEFQDEPFALAHNGNLIRIDKLRQEAKERGYKFQSKSDSEVITALISTSEEKDFLDALKKTLIRLEGSFSLTILFRDKVIGVRDRYGIRPLCLGRDPNSFILASEECAFRTMNAKFIREIAPGELIVLGKQGIESSFLWAENPSLRLCIFEYIYFARPDSRLAGTRVGIYRENAGKLVAAEHPVKGDLVCAVPESGEIYNYGVSNFLKIPLAKAIFRNRYFSTRTFLTPRETNRRALQRRKFYVLEEVVRGKKVILTEDSIIRGNVSTEITAMLREAGAKEVHLRVGSSPIRWPCFLGIDMATKQELIADSLNEEEVAKIIGVDSLGYLSIEGMIKATGLSKENLCLGCFTGKYPIKPPENL